MSLCRFFQKGTCRFGDKCRYRHVTEEREKNKVDEQKKGDWDDEAIMKRGNDSDDNESIASGFTEVPSVKKVFKYFASLLTKNPMFGRQICLCADKFYKAILSGW